MQPLIGYLLHVKWGFPGDSAVKNLPTNVGDSGSISGLRKDPGERNGNPFEHSCLESPTGGGDWQITVHGVSKCWTPFSD